MNSFFGKENENIYPFSAPVHSGHFQQSCSSS